MFALNTNLNTIIVQAFVLLFKINVLCDKRIVVQKWWSDMRSDKVKFKDG